MRFLLAGAASRSGMKWPAFSVVTNKPDAERAKEIKGRKRKREAVVDSGLLEGVRGGLEVRQAEDGRLSATLHIVPEPTIRKKSESSTPNAHLTYSRQRRTSSFLPLLTNFSLTAEAEVSPACRPGSRSRGRCQGCQISH